MLIAGQKRQQLQGWGVWGTRDPRNCDGLGILEFVDYVFACLHMPQQARFWFLTERVRVLGSRNIPFDSLDPQLVFSHVKSAPTVTRLALGCTIGDYCRSCISEISERISVFHGSI